MTVASNRRILASEIKLVTELEQGYRFDGSVKLDIRRIRDKGKKDARVVITGVLAGRLFDADSEAWYDVAEYDDNLDLEARWVDGELPYRHRWALRYVDDAKFWEAFKAELEKLDIAGALEKVESKVSAKRAKEKAESIDLAARVTLAEKWAEAFRALYPGDADYKVKISVWTKGDLVRVYFNWSSWDRYKNCWTRSEHGDTGPMWDARPHMLYLDGKGVLRGKGSQNIQDALKSAGIERAA
jgi:hypothetical protein